MAFWRWRIWRNWHHNCCLIFERGAVVGEGMDIVTNHELLEFGVLGMKEWRGEIRQNDLEMNPLGYYSNRSRDTEVLFNQELPYLQSSGWQLGKYLT